MSAKKRKKDREYREHTSRFFCDLCSHSAYVTLARYAGRAVKVAVRPTTVAEIQGVSALFGEAPQRQLGVYCVGCGEQMRMVESLQLAAID